MYRMNIFILLFVIFSNTPTYQQEIPGAYEVRDLSLNRPYPFGRLLLLLFLFEISNEMFSLFDNQFSLAINWKYISN